MNNLSQVLRKAAKDFPDKPIHFFEDLAGNLEPSSTLTYNELYVEAKKLTQQLEKRGLRSNDPVIFQLESLRDIIISFWACVLGGITLTLRVKTHSVKCIPHLACSVAL
jgi:acyl-CoA synthetase (AMP-forming)/AMP-acid ligase II